MATPMLHRIPKLIMNPMELSMAMVYRLVMSGLHGQLGSINFSHRSPDPLYIFLFTPVSKSSEFSFLCDGEKAMINRVPLAELPTRVNTYSLNSTASLPGGFMVPSSSNIRLQSRQAGVLMAMFTVRVVECQHYTNQPTNPPITRTRTIRTVWFSLFCANGDGDDDARP